MGSQERSAGVVRQPRPWRLQPDPKGRCNVGHAQARLLVEELQSGTVRHKYSIPQHRVPAPGSASSCATANRTDAEWPDGWKDLVRDQLAKPVHAGGFLGGCHRPDPDRRHVCAWVGHTRWEISVNGKIQWDPVTLAAGVTLNPSPSYAVVLTSTAASIKINKTPPTQTVALDGDASFTIEVINTGIVDLTGINVVDSDTSACTNLNIPNLPAGGKHSYPCKHTGVTAGFTGKAIVTSTTPSHSSVFDSVDARVDLTQTDISITKKLDSPRVPFGGTASFTIEVTNNDRGCGST